MIDKSEPFSNVIPFSTRLRLVPASPDPPQQYASNVDEALSLVEHDGRAYNLAALIRHLSSAELREVGATAPRSGQALWDEVVRHWPALADEIAAGVGPLS